MGGLVILVWAWLTGRLRGFGIARDEWRPLLVIGLLFAAQIASMNVGTGLTSAAHATILLNTYAVHFVVLAHFMIPGDRLTPKRLGGVLIAYAGIVVLFARHAFGGSATLLGDVIMFASALLLAERTVYLARAVQKFEPVKLLLSQALVGLALFLVGAALFEPTVTRWTTQLAVVIAFQGAVVAGFNFVINLWLLKQYRPSALAGFFLTQPVFGVIAAAIFTGERLTLEVLLASIAVAIGIGLTAR